MKLHLAALAVLIGTASIACAQTTTLNIDPNHSEADFSIKHMEISRVHGQFSHITGTVVLDSKNMAKSSVDAVIPINTVDTGVAMRDNDLRGKDFFNVAQFPTMTFKSTSVTPDSGGYKVVGNLTMHGVTRPVTLQMDDPSNPITLRGQIHRGFQATTTLDRKDFGLNWNGLLPDGDAMIGDHVKITLDVEAIQK
jgi:polyisoprenoid-binding protein YceI